MFVLMTLMFILMNYTLTVSVRNATLFHQCILYFVKNFDPDRLFEVTYCTMFLKSEAYVLSKAPIKACWYF